MTTLSCGTSSWGSRSGWDSRSRRFTKSRMIEVDQATKKTWLLLSDGLFVGRYVWRFSLTYPFWVCKRLWYIPHHPVHLIRLEKPKMAVHSLSWSRVSTWDLIPLIRTIVWGAGYSTLTNCGLIEHLTWCCFVSPMPVAPNRHVLSSICR